jgi:hypothetical protein
MTATDFSRSLNIDTRYTAIVLRAEVSKSAENKPPFSTTSKPRTRNQAFGTFPTVFSTGTMPIMATRRASVRQAFAKLMLRVPNLTSKLSQNPNVRMARLSQHRAIHSTLTCNSCSGTQTPTIRGQTVGMFRQIFRCARL